MKKLTLSLLLILFPIIQQSSLAQVIHYNVYIPAQIMFTADLNAAQESPADTSKATGTFYAILSSNRGQLDYRVTYAGLTSSFTAAHFHLGAAGVSGNVIKPITTFSGNTAVGTWSSLPDSVVGELMNGKIYINIHSSNYPGGEIRGQIYPVHGIGFTISMDSSQVTSTVNSSAAGTGWAILTDSASIPSLSYGMTIAGLSSSYTASHFHIGNMGTDGTVVHPFSFTDSSAYGTWSGIDDNDLLALVRNGLYVNVHTSNYPSGEIRGQVNEVTPISFYSSLNGASEVPAVTTNATGTGWFVLSSSQNSLDYHITYANLQGTFTASHIHLGAIGVGGSVVEPITTYTGNTAAGTWASIPDSLVVDMIKGNLYVNVHSSVHPSGEIRGQLMLNYDNAMAADLGGSQEVPALSVTGSGTSWLTLKDDTLWYQITVAGLTSNLSSANFYNQQLGFNGSVMAPITFSDSTASSFWPDLPDTTISEILKQECYINVNTANNSTGEIRGQVISLDYDNVDVTGISANDNSALPKNYYLNQNYPNPFNPNTIISYSLPKAGLVTLKVYDILGREVTTLVNSREAAGNYKINFNAEKLSSGVYFYRLRSGSFSDTKKLILLK